jgi:hypothetical protein
MHALPPHSAARDPAPAAAKSRHARVDAGGALENRRFPFPHVLIDVSPKFWRSAFSSYFLLRKVTHRRLSRWMGRAYHPAR